MDEQYHLTTPENIPINYELSGIGSRFVAALLDGLIVAAGMIAIMVLALVFTLAFWRDDSLMGGLAIAIVILAALVLTLGYSLFFEIAWSGQTPGKRASGIRVIREDGSPITALAAVIRNVLRIVDQLPAYYIIGTIVILVDSKGRRLGDLAAGTVVVKERRGVAVDRLTLADAMSVERDADGKDEDTEESEGGNGFGEQVDLRRLTADDRYLIKEYLLRREQLNPQAAQQLAAKIANRVAAQLEVTPGDESADEFLARLGRGL